MRSEERDMSKFEATPQRVANEYQAGLQFNNGIRLYECVETNENFFIGKQWKGCSPTACPPPSLTS